MSEKSFRLMMAGIFAKVLTLCIFKTKLKCIGIPISQTLDFSYLPITQTKHHFPSHFVPVEHCNNFTPNLLNNDNSNLFSFSLFTSSSIKFITVTCRNTVITQITTTLVLILILLAITFWNTSEKFFVASWIDSQKKNLQYKKLCVLT